MPGYYKSKITTTRMNVCVCYMLSLFFVLSAYGYGKSKFIGEKVVFFSRFDDPIVRKDMYFPYGGNVKIVLFSNYKKRDK